MARSSTKQFDVFSISGGLVAQVHAGETTLVRDILQQVSDTNGTPRQCMRLIYSGDLEAVSDLKETACLSEECFLEDSEISFTVVFQQAQAWAGDDEAVAPKQLDFRLVVRKLTPCMQEWARHAIAILLGIVMVGIAMVLFVGFIFALISSGTEKGPNLYEQICFIAFVCLTSIIIIGVFSRSAFEAIARGRFRESLKDCARGAIFLTVVLAGMGLAATAFLGFILFCVATNSAEGPNLFETTCFVLATSISSITLIILTIRIIHDAVKQGKVGENVRECASNAIKILVVFVVLGSGMTIFVGFIFFCITADSTHGHGPNLFELICFIAAICIASISIILVVGRAVYNAIVQGRCGERAKECVYSTAVLLVGMTAFGLVTVVFLGFIFGCIAMGTVEGPNIFELISFITFIFGAAVACCGYTCMTIYDSVRNALNAP